MEIHSISPVWLEMISEENMTRTTIIQDEHDYLHITFVDDTDDCMSPEQTIKIHPVDLGKFIEMLNRTYNLL